MATVYLWPFAVEVEALRGEDPQVRMTLRVSEEPGELPPGVTPSSHATVEMLPDHAAKLIAALATALAEATQEP